MPIYYGLAEAVIIAVACPAKSVKVCKAFRVCVESLSPFYRPTCISGSSSHSTCPEFLHNHKATLARKPLDSRLLPGLSPTSSHALFHCTVM